MANLWREPLVHFLLAGVGVFVVVALLGDDAEDRGDRIVVTLQDIRGLGEVWEQQWQRPPTEAELLGQISAFVRIELLYREAMAVGLDQNDPVIRRRLAQRMQFVLEAEGDYEALAERYEIDIGDERLARLYAESAAPAEPQQ